MACDACKTIPPVIAEGYEPKGKWEEIAGFKTYVTGDESKATKSIVEIYDIFGPANQTLQGADLLAATLDVLVLIPDLLKGEYAQGAWFSNPTPELEAAKNAYFAKVMNFGPFVEGLANVVQAGKARFPGVDSWGAVGLCWGGKVVVMQSGSGTALKVTAQVHPAGLAKGDAEKITIPHILLASNGEDAEVVKQYKAIIEGDGKPGVVETYANMHHGWMGARANLSDEENLKEYKRGYSQLAGFFSKHL